MASSSFSSLLIYTQITLFLLILVLVSLTRASRAADVAMVDLSGDEIDWPTPSTSIYDGIDEIEIEEEDALAGGGRRSLMWSRMRYYISYGALSANRVPCPPRSGRSYYTHDCWRARGPVRPYTRGCSAITRCRR
ncbi:hypothetical protein SSX86_025170 [Deinandra increscens subsp. villosa]|uniref:Uncharacterized protein n=1 Tax=Deinandra increscens subsp. villosa TaxID=3103831 RepID=A0AAP0CFQ8_9ASTR